MIDEMSPGASESSETPLTKNQTGLLMVSVMVVALCGIVYELIIAAVSSYLIGNSVYQFSITIGLFMFAMGLGSYLTKWINRDLVERFIAIEIAVALVGGICSSLLFLLFPYASFYKPSMFGLIIVIGTLVGLEIPLLTRILSRSSEWKQAIANVLSLDYVGALFGAVGFPILMLPTLGLFRSSFAIGLLNIAVALAAILMFGRQLKGYGKLLASSVFVLLILFGGLLASQWLTKYAESRMYADTIVYTEQTAYQRIVITENAKSNDLRLYLDKHIQFSSLDEHRYHESLVHPVMSLAGPKKNVLILGGGDGMAVREVLKHPEVERIVLVDIDPAMTKLCSTFGPIVRLNERALEDPKLKIVNADGFNYLMDYAGNLGPDQPPFDRVIVDFPDPHNEVLDKLYSKEFYHITKSCMSPDGFLVSQCSSPFFATDVYWSIRKTMEAAKFHVKSFRVPMVSFGIWGFHLCSVRESPNWKTDIDRVSCKYLSDAVFAANCQFGKDISTAETVVVNRTFEPKLYTLYEKGLHSKKKFHHEKSKD